MRVMMNINNMKEKKEEGEERRRQQGMVFHHIYDKKAPIIGFSSLSSLSLLCDISTDVPDASTIDSIVLVYFYDAVVIVIVCMPAALLLLCEQ